MTMTRLGILHPGEMGISIAASALHSLPAVYWCSEGRSEATRQRAGAHGLSEIPKLDGFCKDCDIIIAVCPPHAAVKQARAVIATGYQGIYVDANAVSPDTVRGIAKEMQHAGISFIDGGIIGLPAWQPGKTWLYLSGNDAGQVAQCFTSGPLETEVLGGEVGQASALKLCFAAWNKGKTALVTSILAAADNLGVRDALEKQWDIYEPGFSEATSRRICGVAHKAWRFTGEMQEIRDMLAAENLPPEFFDGAAAVYERQKEYKDAKVPPGLPELLQAVRRKS
jgi:3-hydroxyisobutyrate dehydrogenase-like beta-hydroxyacid dehydrogenase